jgi:hypothetical protein
MEAATLHPRARCFACKRLRRIDDLEVTYQSEYEVTALGRCPCGEGFRARREGVLVEAATYRIVGVKGVKTPKVTCSLDCQTAQALTCRCSCGGSSHGVRG